MLQAVVGSVAGAGNFALIQQRVEGVRELSDKTVTVSFKAKASVANFKVGVEAQQSFGPGGSAGVDSIVSSVTLGTDWQKFSVQLALPSVVGKTITTGDYLQISFWLDAGANFAGRSGNAGQKMERLALPKCSSKKEQSRRSLSIDRMPSNWLYVSATMKRRTAWEKVRAPLPVRVVCEAD